MSSRNSDLSEARPPLDARTATPATEGDHIRVERLGLTRHFETIVGIAARSLTATPNRAVVIAERRTIVAGLQ
jgi:hypothetical protein